MTDTSYPLTTIAPHDYNLPPLPHNGPLGGGGAPRPHHHAPPVLEIAQEDDGQISCICGYIDDDGWTVQCDQCNRWQHQSCYYPEYEDRSLPDDLQHYCVDCHKRPFNHERAHERQRSKREDAASELNGGVKRAAPKSHKKKVKENAAATAYTNGWPLDKSRHDRNSASPRDQPPPAKRPKTSHRPSDSVATTASTKGHSRKRNASSVNHRRSLSRSPEMPIDLYSEHFMRCYLDDEWVVSDSNLHASTDVRNALSDWLAAPDDNFREMHGCEKRDVLWRWDRELDAIPNKAQIEIREEHDERVKDDAGNHPTWKWVTVQESIAEGAYIGELKGYVGFKEDYIQESANRWTVLRHPEPFVFFHPRLPIYIDARNEGTELRYVRRSCVPNARLSILVTEATDYHFCFMATQQIDPGMEVAVAWDTWDSVPALQGKQNNLSDLDLEYLRSWVSKVLANCGPCACQLPGDNCRMARFDRRGVASGSESKNDHEQQQMMKAPSKTKKKQRALPNHMSPLNTNLHSRSGSEARKVDPADDDQQRSADSRSPSASAGRDSASRDMTPNNTHYVHGAIPEMSERERKKLAKEEEMFKKQEVEQSGKQGKKKRNSGGSTLSTPSATASRPLGFGSAVSSTAGPNRYADASTSKQTGLPPTKVGKRTKSSTHKSPAASIARGLKRPKPEYVDSGVQCDLDLEEDARRPAVLLPHRPFLSTTQRLLQRCALNNARRRGPAALAEAERLLSVGDKMDVDPVPASTTSANPFSPKPGLMHTIPEVRDDGSNDVEMNDATASDIGAAGVVHVEPGIPQEHQPHLAMPTILTTDPPPPPWPSQTHPSNSETDSGNPTPPLKPTGMHLQMPPPPSNPFAAAAAPSSALSTGTPTSALIQSPISISGSNPMFSPSVNAAVAPSPAKKKLSLSDYTRRNKAKDHRDSAGGDVKGERESSPASVTSAGTSSAVPPSLPTVHSDPSRAADPESSSAIVEDGEDVKMEDLVEPPASVVIVDAGDVPPRPPS